MIVAALLLAAAAPASTGAEELAVHALYSFAACAVQRTPEGARALLAMDYRSAEYHKRLRAYMKGHEDCIGRGARLGASQLLIGGSLAEALLKSDFPASQLPQRLSFDPQREVIEARGEGEAMAVCTVMQDPQTAAKIFDTEPATGDEANAMKPLGAVLVQCLKQGTQMTLNKPALRSLLALAAWRIATMPRKAAS
jgi:hypothetical protein